MWDLERSGDYLSLLSQEVNIEKLLSIKQNLEGISNRDQLETCTKDPTDLLYSNAVKVFKLKARRKNIPYKPKGKPWFKNSCTNLKKRLSNLVRLLLKSPKDPIIKGNFVKIKKEFKKLVKDSKKEFEVDKINKFGDLAKAPKQFWAQLKKN